MKENSPLKKMGSLRKQSKQMQQENTSSPLKVFGEVNKNTQSPSKNAVRPTLSAKN